MILVQDNFLSNPYELRNIAVKSHYEISDDGRWPGCRTDAPKSVGDYFIEQVEYLTQDAPLYPYDGKEGRATFQSITQEYKEGLFHCDDGIKYTCIVFLSLAPPSNSGPEVTDQWDMHTIEQKSIDAYTFAKRSFYSNTKSWLNRYRYDRMVKAHNSNYVPVLKVPNKFNRMVLFDGERAHRAQNFFGSNIHDSRLTLITFLK